MTVQSLPPFAGAAAGRENESASCRFKTHIDCTTSMGEKRMRFDPDDPSLVKLLRVGVAVATPNSMIRDIHTTSGSATPCLHPSYCFSPSPNYPTRTYPTGRSQSTIAQISTVFRSSHRVYLASVATPPPQINSLGFAQIPASQPRPGQHHAVVKNQA